MGKFKELDIQRADLRECKDVLDLIMPGFYGRDYIIAGGYARDTWYNVIPKDIDVIVQFTPPVLHAVLENLNSFAIPFRSFGAHYGDSPIDNRAESVIKLVNHPIDIIFTHDDPHTAVGRFDFNINQCYLNYKDQVCWVAGTEPTGIECIVNDITDDRRKYMYHKWSTLRGQV